MDGFDHLPDSLVLQIINNASEVKTLARLRSVSRRFNSLVPQAESLLLRVDCVVSPESDSESLFPAFLRAIFRIFKLEDGPKTRIPGARSNHSPTQILARFDRIRELKMELPSGDLKLEKGVSVKWRAEFGRTLKSCVILGFREEEEEVGDFPNGLKTGVVWTISALIAASARHHLLRDVVREHEELGQLQLYDRESEGVVVMKEEGLREFRVSNWGEESAFGGAGGSRTVVPSVRMRMRHAPRVSVGGSCVLRGTLIVVRPVGSAESCSDAELAFGAFEGGIYGEAIGELLKCNSYLLEMNSF